MSRPKRIPAYPYLGEQRYFITVCTFDRAPYFTTAEVVALVVGILIQTATAYRFTIVAYCVMPDHIHLLLDGDDEGSDLKAFMKAAKQRAGFQFKQRYRQPLWQEGYYEHILRDEERTEEVVYYIIANPIRKHLVNNVLDYPHWGSMRCSRRSFCTALD